MRNKIGVYICHCGGNIADYVDVAKVKDLVAGEEGVELVKTTLLACADSAQKEIVRDIDEQKLDAIVVASCSPKLHLTTFRAAAERAGLNPYHYVQVNIREQGSWAHSDMPGQATDKAVRLVRAGIARVRNSQALSPIKISAVNSTTVIGAGVSGMRASIELADMGTQVYLIENSHFIGGRVPQWGELFPTEKNGEDIVNQLIGEIKKRENITLLTGTEVEALSGCLGSIELTLKINPRYIEKNVDDDLLKKAVEKCPVEVGDEFNFLLTKRKAIYKPYENAFPQTPVIDMDSCTRCGECTSICPAGINLDQKCETRTIKTGAIILNTGFDPYEPEEGEYGYKKSITSSLSSSLSAWWN
jgi:heterodisulfide reductase subunit A